MVYLAAIGILMAAIFFVAQAILALVTVVLIAGAVLIALRLIFWIWGRRLE